MEGRFIPIFSRLALVVFALALVVVSGPLLFLLQMPLDEIRVTDRGQSQLLNLLLHHPLAFTASLWFYCFAAVIASIGLMRRRKWGHTAWLVLLGFGLAWSCTVVISETLHFIAAHPSPTESFGVLHNDAAISFLAAVPVSVVLIAVQAVVVRKLLREREVETIE